MAKQESYSWPEDLILPLRVVVGGFPRASADPTTVERFRKGELVLQDRGVWFEQPDSSGTRSLHLYPTPSGGATLEVEWIWRPDPFVTDNDIPYELPEEFHPAILPEVASVYYETVEDNPELAQRHSDKSDAEVAAIQRYDNERRSGSGVFRVPIVGVSA